MNNLKKDIEKLKLYLFQNDKLKNDEILNSYFDKILSNDLFNDSCFEKIKKEFEIKNKSLLDLICNDLSLFGELQETDFNAVVYHRVIVTHIFNYISNNLENYKIEEHTSSYDISISGYRMVINLKKPVNLNWSVNKLKKYFKTYYSNNAPKKLITSISINNNELQLM